MPKKIGDKDLNLAIDTAAFAQALKSARKERGLTQPQVAELANTSTKTVSLYETGKSIPTVRALRALCAVYDKPIEEFLVLLGLGITEDDQTYALEVVGVEKVRKKLSDNSHRLTAEDVERIDDFIDFVLEKPSRKEQE